jgi:hypothetical protein
MLVRGAGRGQYGGHSRGLPVYSYACLPFFLSNLFFSTCRLQKSPRMSLPAHSSVLPTMQQQLGFAVSIKAVSASKQGLESKDTSCYLSSNLPTTSAIGPGARFSCLVPVSVHAYRLSWRSIPGRLVIATTITETLSFTL